MSQRINISVPDEMAEKLEKFKGKFKVSKVCQKALKEAVMFEEIKESPDIETLRVKLKNERDELFKSYRDAGYNDGLKEAYGFSYEEFNREISTICSLTATSGERFDYFEYVKDRENAAKGTAILNGELTLGKLPDYRSEPTLGAYDSERYDAYDAYIEGWITAIKTVWQQVNMD